MTGFFVAIDDLGIINFHFRTQHDITELQYSTMDEGNNGSSANDEDSMADSRDNGTSANNEEDRQQEQANDDEASCDHEE